MACGHCCYSCAFEGIDMPWEIFKLAMDKWGHLVYKIKNNISIGGGEPTLHPDFWKMLNYTMLYGRPWLATNGSLTEDVLRLVKMAKSGFVKVSLSMDKYHEHIDPKVVQVFKDGLYRHPYPGSNKKSIEDKTCSFEWYPGQDNYIDGRTIRISRNPKKAGRSKEGVIACCCPVLQVKPTGDITGCGCPDAKLVGTVQDGFFKEYEDRIPILKEGATCMDIYRCSKTWVKEQK